MWRIAQEALANVERHSGATQARVLWRCNGEAAALEVTDNGSGFPIGKAGRLDSYGLLGMRERASSIGATLDVTSQEGKGTRVRCSLLRTEPVDDRPAVQPVAVV
jgi:signal transduction histidine kinase